MMHSAKATTAYVGAFVDELARSGVRHVVISPGSRSTPMAMLMAEHPDIRVWMHVDERSAGFFALGLAKAQGKPAALLCTSGTAAANYSPAVVEASLSRVPLLVLTADRPHELRDVGAPQAIDQLRLYGSYVKWFQEMAIPEETEPMLRYVRTVAARAAGLAAAGPKGPVHLNFPFREPLVPDLSSPLLFSGGEREEGSAPYVTVSPGHRELLPEQIDRLAAELGEVERGLIVCGPQEDPALAEPLLRLAEALRFPVLADPLSQLRSGRHDLSGIVDGYDAFLRSPDRVRDLAPDVVIRFGAMPVSKAWMLYLKAHPGCRQIVVDPDGGWREPTLLASDMIHAEPVTLCEALVDRLQGKPRGSSPWMDRWMAINRRTREVLRTEGRTESLFEGRIFLELMEHLPEGTLLFAGNSMPVRDMDSFFLCNSRGIRTMANRGANGIDGVVSTAMGAAAEGMPVVLVIGDLSFFHDLNGLLAAKLYRLNVTVILVNNDGGGIFSFLPQSEHPVHFEELFGTPLGLDYALAVRMHGGSHERVESWECFRKALSRGLREEGLTVIEVRTDREENVRMHRWVWQAVERSLTEGPEAGDRR